MEQEESSTIDLRSDLYDKKPITWLIRELEKQIEKGNDYVEFTLDTYHGNTDYLLICSKS